MLLLVSPAGMLRFVGGDFSLVLQGQSNIVQALEQAVPNKVVDLKAGAESAIVVDLALLKIHGDLVICLLVRPPHEFSNLLFAEHDVEEPVLAAVVRKNVGEGRGNHHSKPKVCQRPHGMFARGSATKILSGYEDAGSPVSRLIEHKRGLRLR